jgi:hypothetical protein
LGVTSDERIRELAEQLLRAEHPVVLDTVAAQLHLAIDEYVAVAKCEMPCAELLTPPVP